uniref:Cell cycle associated protein 1a n=1 Tax=Myripristis murdjan TaxID=586833 RepID=A0A668A9V4_9TELE
MPSAMVGNNAVQSASPELGSGSHSEAMKQILGVIDKKVRNMEKKKAKLDDYQARKNKGERLNQDQLEALSKSQEVINNLEFARELQKSFLTLGQEVQKAVKKSARREQLQREEMEQRRLKTVLELQFLLDRLGDDTVRQDMKRPDATGSPLLTDADLTTLDEFYKLVGPDRNYDVRLTEQYEEASLHLWELLEGRDKAVAGTTYKALKDTLDKVLLSGYFDRAQTHQNGLCEEEEEDEDQTVVAETKAAEQPSEPGKNHHTTFVNRQFIPETTYSSTNKDQVEDWTVEAQMVNSLQHQPPAPLAPEPSITVNHANQTTDPVVRKQAVQDLMAQMQGTYNFMQVFNLNAPVPPASDGQGEPLKPPSQFPSGYGQGFTSQSENTVDQPDITQEALQSVVSGFQPQDQVMPSAGGHEQSSPGAGFGRSGQSFYNSRGIPRGGPRNARGMMNGYRGSSNGFRGGYEGYRPPFANTPNSGYGQTQFNTSRDYSSSSYQREGYQQGYKRGAAQGPRGCGRGNAQAMRS